MGDAYDVRSSFERSRSAVYGAVEFRNGVHLHAVADYHAAKAQLFAEKSREYAPRHSGGQLFGFEGREQHMTGHYGGYTGLNGAAERQQFAFFQLFAALIHARQADVRVRVGVAVTREMFAAGHDAPVKQAAHKTHCPLRGLLRQISKAAHTDNRVERVGVHVKHRREVKIHTCGAKLCRREPRRSVRRVPSRGCQGHGSRRSGHVW